VETCSGPPRARARARPLLPTIGPGVGPEAMPRGGARRNQLYISLFYLFNRPALINALELALQLPQYPLENRSAGRE
jgi:hypothetical protein